MSVSVHPLNQNLSRNWRAPLPRRPDFISGSVCRRAAGALFSPQPSLCSCSKYAFISASPSLWKPWNHRPGMVCRRFSWLVVQENQNNDVSFAKPKKQKVRWCLGPSESFLAADTKCREQGGVLSKHLSDSVRGWGVPTSGGWWVWDLARAVRPLSLVQAAPFLCPGRTLGGVSRCCSHHGGATSCHHHIGSGVNV